MTRLDNIKGNTYGPAAARDINWLIAELERQRETIDKLPKTADGVPVVPGMTLYAPNGLGNPPITEYALSDSRDGYEIWHSTHAAAEAALRERSEP